MYDTTKYYETGHYRTFYLWMADEAKITISQVKIRKNKSPYVNRAKDSITQII